MKLAALETDGFEYTQQPRLTSLKSTLRWCTSWVCSWN